MNVIHGVVVAPPNVPVRTYQRLVVEARDVSLADAPSVVLAASEATQVTLGPNDQAAFSMMLPAVDQRASVSVRAHASMDGSDQVKPGDLLTTTSYPITAAGSQTLIIRLSEI